MSITLTDVTHIYMPGTPFERVGIAKVSIEIKRGDFVAVIGHTGSGKSTLIQHCNGLLKPTSGRIEVDEIDIHAKDAGGREARRKVGMVFQHPERQLFEETVFDDIAFGPRNLALDETEVAQRVRCALAFVGLDYDTYAKRSPFHLSGGQMRRVAIAGVVALEPEYLILDEPSAGLDPRGRSEIFEQIIELHRQTGIAVVLVSHNMEEVFRMANRIVVMHQGSISLDGPPLDIFRYGRDKLRAAGVDVPNVIELLSSLRQRGLHVDDVALTAEDAAQAIYTAVRRR